MHSALQVPHMKGEERTTSLNCPHQESKNFQESPTANFTFGLTSQNCHMATFKPQGKASWQWELSQFTYSVCHKWYMKS